MIFLKKPQDLILNNRMHFTLLIRTTESMFNLLFTMREIVSQVEKKKKYKYNRMRKVVSKLENMHKSYI